MPIDPKEFGLDPNEKSRAVYSPNIPLPSSKEAAANPDVLWTFDSTEQDIKDQKSRNERIIGNYILKPVGYLGVSALSGISDLGGLGLEVLKGGYAAVVNPFSDKSFSELYKDTGRNPFHDLSTNMLEGYRDITEMYSDSKTLWGSLEEANLAVINSLGEFGVAGFGLGQGASALAKASSKLATSSSSLAQFGSKILNPLGQGSKVAKYAETLLASESPGAKALGKALSAVSGGEGMYGVNYGLGLIEGVKSGRAQIDENLKTAYLKLSTDYEKERANIDPNNQEQLSALDVKYQDLYSKTENAVYAGGLMTMAMNTALVGGMGHLTGFQAFAKTSASLNFKQSIAKALGKTVKDIEMNPKLIQDFASGQLQAVKTGFTTQLKDLLLDSGKEGIEELMNMFSEKTGSSYVNQKIKDPESTFSMANVGEAFWSLASKEGIETFLMGAYSGGMSMQGERAFAKIMKKDEKSNALLKEKAGDLMKTYETTRNNIKKLSDQKISIAKADNYIENGEHEKYIEIVASQFNKELLDSIHQETLPMNVKLMEMDVEQAKTEKAEIDSQLVTTTDETLKASLKGKSELLGFQIENGIQATKIAKGYEKTYNETLKTVQHEGLAKQMMGLHIQNKHIDQFLKQGNYIYKQDVEEELKKIEGSGFTSERVLSKIDEIVKLNQRILSVKAKSSDSKSLIDKALSYLGITSNYIAKTNETEAATLELRKQAIEDINTKREKLLTELKEELTTSLDNSKLSESEKQDLEITIDKALQNKLYEASIQETKAANEAFLKEVQSDNELRATVINELNSKEKKEILNKKLTDSYYSKRRVQLMNEISMMAEEHLVIEKSIFNEYENNTLKDSYEANLANKRTRKPRTEDIVLEEEIVINEEIEEEIPLEENLSSTKEETLKKLDEVLKNKDFIELRGTGKNTYYFNTKTGTKLNRVTKVINDEIETTDMLNTANALGTQIDGFVRDFFDGTLKPLDDYKFADNAKLNSFLAQLQKLKDKFDANGETVYPKEITLYNDKLGVAGTIDLLTVDNDSRVRIYDMKTMRKNMLVEKDTNEVILYDSTEYGETTRSKHAKQLSLYRILLNNTHGLTAVELGIIPIKISYESGDTSVKAVNLLDIIPVTPLEIVDTKDSSLPEIKLAEIVALSKTPTKIDDIKRRWKDDLNKLKTLNLGDTFAPKGTVNEKLTQIAKFFISNFGWKFESDTKDIAYASKERNRVEFVIDGLDVNLKAGQTLSLMASQAYATFTPEDVINAKYNAEIAATSKVEPIKLKENPTSDTDTQIKQLEAQKTNVKKNYEKDKKELIEGYSVIERYEELQDELKTAENSLNPPFGTLEEDEIEELEAEISSINSKLAGLQSKYDAAISYIDISVNQDNALQNLDIEYEARIREIEEAQILLAGTIEQDTDLSEGDEQEDTTPQLSESLSKELAPLILEPSSLQVDETEALIENQIIPLIFPQLTEEYKTIEQIDNIYDRSDALINLMNSVPKEERKQVSEKLDNNEYSIDDFHLNNEKEIVDIIEEGEEIISIHEQDIIRLDMFSIDPKMMQYDHRTNKVIGIKKDENGNVPYTTINILDGVYNGETFKLKLVPKATYDKPSNFEKKQSIIDENLRKQAEKESKKKEAVEDLTNELYEKYEELDRYSKIAEANTYSIDYKVLELLTDKINKDEAIRLTGFKQLSSSFVSKNGVSIDSISNSISNTLGINQNEVINTIQRLLGENNSKAAIMNKMNNKSVISELKSEVKALEKKIAAINHENYISSDEVQDKRFALVIERLKSIFKGVNIVVGTDSDIREKYPEQLDGEVPLSSRRGWFDSNTNTIFINRSHPRTSINTIVHEFAHPFIKALKRENKELYENILATAKKMTTTSYDDGKEQNILDYVKKKSVYDKSMDEEIIAIALEEMSKTNYSFNKDNTKIINKFAKLLTDMFNYFFGSLLKSVMNPNTNKPYTKKEINVELKNLESNMSLSHVSQFFINNKFRIDLSQKSDQLEKKDLVTQRIKYQKNIDELKYSMLNACK